MATDLPAPNEPPKVREISATELKAMMDRGAPFELIDVRTPAERATAMIAGSRLLDQETYESLLRMDRSATIAFHCHLGDRSRSAAEHFRQQGFLNLYNVRDGIDGWSRLVDASVPRY
jgi:rhodanese-related sulfurtransferase